MFRSLIAPVAVGGASFLGCAGAPPAPPIAVAVVPPAPTATAPVSPAVVSAPSEPRAEQRSALIEVARILSPDRGPTVDPEASLTAVASLDLDWDPSRVTLTTFEQKGRRVRLRGSARGAEDVAQFVRRLAVSLVFADVVLRATDRVANPSAADAVTFEASATAKGEPAVGETVELHAWSGERDAGLRDPFVRPGGKPADPRR